MAKKKWKCATCGYVHDGDDPPQTCPKCGAARDALVALDDNAATLVERSRRTNALHCRLVSLSREIEGLCKDGIEDNLDPGCVALMYHTQNKPRFSLSSVVCLLPSVLCHGLRAVFHDVQKYLLNLATLTRDLG